MPEGDADILLHPGYAKDPEHLWIWGNHPGFTDDQAQKFKQAIISKRSAFAYDLSELYGYTGPHGEFTIPLEHNQDIRFRPRRLSQKEQEIVDMKCKELLDQGFIAPCRDTRYVQNVVVAAKKDEQGNYTDFRFCIDYRPINKVTPPDKYPLHLADDLWDRIGKAKYLTKIDMRAGFHNIPIAQADQPKSAFWWGNRAYMYTRCPFGLRNIPAFFQRVMDTQIAAHRLENCCVCFIDDLLIFSDTAEQHTLDVCAVLDAFAEVGLKAHPGKSIFGAPVVEYLGHNVSAYGVSPTEAKVAAIRAIKAPVNVAQLWSVLGLVGYYRCYVPNFGAIAAPLNDLLKAQSVWNWQDHIHGEALRKLIDNVCTPGRILRRADPARPFILHTDWSKEGVGAVLGQKDEDLQEYLIACISRSLNKHERNYSSPQGEMLAAVWGIKSFRHYLRFTRFTLSTDHAALLWLMETKELSGQYARWALILQEFDFEVLHRPGITHQNADAVSRMPLPSPGDTSGARLDPEPAPSAFSAIHYSSGQCMSSLVCCSAMHALFEEDFTVAPWTDLSALSAPEPPVPLVSLAAQAQVDLQSFSTVLVRDTLPALKALPDPIPLTLKVQRNGPSSISCDRLGTVVVGQFFFSPSGPRRHCTL